MAGRFAYFLIAGGALVAGMAVQGDLNFGSDRDALRISRVGGHEEARRIERHTDRLVDRTTERITEREAIRNEQVVQRQMADAIAELVRAESSLIAARLDEDLPASAIKQSEARRNAARDRVERLSNEVEGTSDADRDAIRENIRQSIRDAVRG